MRPPSVIVRVVTALSLAAAGLGAAVVTAGPASAAPCSDIDVSFARGTGEPAGLGTVGSPFTTALRNNLSGYTVNVYAVNYGAAVSQSTAGAGATDMSNHISSVAAACPNTRFVIGGYSQGATVTDIALGIRTSTGGSGTPIPTALQSRVLAAVVFGNPLGLQRQTIASAAPSFAAKSKDYCNSSDTVCGSYQPTGSGSHTSYASNGSTTAGGQFAANLVKAAVAPGGGTTPTTPPTTPAPTPTTPAPTPTTPVPTPTTGACVRTSTQQHVDADRAYSLFGRAYAKGTNDSLGWTSYFVTVSLRQNGPNSWSLVSSC